MTKNKLDNYLIPLINGHLTLTNLKLYTVPYEEIINY